ncbi:MAG: LPP20 family lipoprotein, partial [Terriglobia bacterium]
MILLKRVGYLGFLLTAALWLAACSNRTVVPSNPGIKGAPDWVNQGSQALNDRDGRLIHGIGLAPAMNDLSLQTSTADERARAEVARVLSSFMYM